MCVCEEERVRVCSWRGGDRTPVAQSGSPHWYMSEDGDPTSPDVARSSLVLLLEDCCVLSWVWMYKCFFVRLRVQHAH